MTYKYPRENILLLLQQVGILYRKQLIKLFSKAATGDRYVMAELRRLQASHHIIYNAENDTYCISTYKRLSPAIEEKRLRAFWPIALIGSDDLVSVVPLEYPWQFIWIALDSEESEEDEDKDKDSSKKISNVYDIAVCDQEGDGELAMRMRHTQNLSTGGSEQDTTFHIAMLSDKGLWPELKDAGFDCYVTFNDSTGRVHYYTR